MKGANFTISPQHLQSLTQAINRLKVKSAEKFYTKFYSTIIQNAGTFVPCTNNSSAILILTKLCTVLIGIRQHKKEEYAVSAATARNITERERAGLQYLGGFILRNTHSTMKRSMNAENMDKMKLSMLVVKSFKNKEKPQNQRLVAALDRNGLWYITQDFENILIMAEKTFCYEVQNRKELKLIDQEYIVSKILPLCMDSMYQSIANSDIDISSKNSKDVLQALIKLFVRVRSFNFASDVVQKTKLKITVQNNVKKSLRQNLKATSEPEKYDEI